MIDPFLSLAFGSLLGSLLGIAVVRGDDWSRRSPPPPGTRRKYLNSPATMAECGGFCFETLDPVVCDCGALSRHSAPWDVVMDPRFGIRLGCSFVWTEITSIAATATDAPPCQSHRSFPNPQLPLSRAIPGDTL